METNQHSKKIHRNNSRKFKLYLPSNSLCTLEKIKSRSSVHSKNSSIVKDDNQDTLKNKFNNNLEKFKLNNEKKEEQVIDFNKILKTFQKINNGKGSTQVTNNFYTIFHPEPAQSSICTDTNEKIRSPSNKISRVTKEKSKSDKLIPASLNQLEVEELKNQLKQKNELIRLLLNEKKSLTDKVSNLNESVTILKAKNAELKRIIKNNKNCLQNSFEHKNSNASKLKIPRSMKKYGTGDSIEFYANSNLNNEQTEYLNNFNLEGSTQIEEQRRGLNTPKRTIFELEIMNNEKFNNNKDNKTTNEVTIDENKLEEEWTFQRVKLKTEEILNSYLSILKKV